MSLSIPKEQVVKIGAKGEILLPKDIREYLGWTSDQTVILSVDNDMLFIRKVFSFHEILDRPAKVKISKRAWKQLNEVFSEEINQ